MHPGHRRRTIVAAAASADTSPMTSIAVASGPVVPYILQCSIVIASSQLLTVNLLSIIDVRDLLIGW